MAFSQEIRDFISAFQAGQKLFDTTDRDYKRARTRYLEAQTQKLSDPEMRNLDLEAKRALIAQRKRAGAGLESNRAKRGQLLDLQIQRARKALEDAPSSGPRQDLIEGAAGAGKQSALPVSPTTNLAAYDPELEEEDGEQATAFARRGGVIPVKAYADGGVVEGDEVEEAAAVQATRAIPTEAREDAETTASMDAEDDAGDDDDGVDAGRGYSVEAAHDATRDGLAYGVKSMGLGPQQSGIPDDMSAQRRRTAARAYAQGQGAYTPEEIAEIKKRIDPEGKMSEAQRNMAALGGIYQFYMNRGEFEKAQRAAFGVLQHYRLASQRYAAIAATAAERGDVDGAALAALKAYDNIPDGRDLKVKKQPDGTLAYEVVDEQTGKTISKGLATPQQLAAQAMKVAANGFDQFILEAAGQRSQGGASGGRQRPAAPNVRDRGTALKQIDEAWEAHLEAQAPEGGEAPKIPAAEANLLKTTAYHISSSPKNNLTPLEAIGVASALTTVDPKEPNKLNFEVKPQDDGALVRFRNGRTAFVPREQFEQLVVARGERMKKASERLNKEREATESRERLFNELKQGVGAAVDSFRNREVKPRRDVNPGRRTVEEMREQ